jgi:hypothetical protein
VSKSIHQITAAFVLLFTLVVYLLTVAPTVSFWDCGEFIACAYSLGVPHPPGTPLYILIGRLFTLLPIGADPAFPMNLISVLTSAAAVLFVYLIWTPMKARMKPIGMANCLLLWVEPPPL